MLVFGADWGGEFVSISRKTRVNAYMKLNDEDLAIKCSQELGGGPIKTQQSNGEPPAQIKGLERFVCPVYCSSGPTTIPELI